MPHAAGAAASARIAGCVQIPPNAAVSIGAGRSRSVAWIGMLNVSGAPAAPDDREYDTVTLMDALGPGGSADST
jgi:hypothetical protein